MTTSDIHHNLTFNGLAVLYKIAHLNASNQDLEPGINSEESKIVLSSCISTKHPIVYIHKLRWSYYLKEDAAKDSLEIKLKNYGETYLGYIGTNEYKIEDTDGNTIPIKVKSINTKSGVITLDAKLPQDLKIAKKAALIWPLGGLSGTPVWVSDVGTENDIANYCAHELGHELIEWEDVCELDNVMFGGSATGTNLRHRPLKNYYDTSQLSTQWTTMKGR